MPRSCSQPRLPASQRPHRAYFAAERDLVVELAGTAAVAGERRAPGGAVVAEGAQCRVDAHALAHPASLVQSAAGVRIAAGSCQALCFIRSSTSWPGSRVLPQASLRARPTKNPAAIEHGELGACAEAQFRSPCAACHANGAILRKVFYSKHFPSNGRSSAPRRTPPTTVADCLLSLKKLPHRSSAAATSGGA